MTELKVMGDSKQPADRTAAAGEPSEEALRADPMVGQLRKLYDKVAEEPLPEGLAQLLAKLDEAERNR